MSAPPAVANADLAKSPLEAFTAEISRPKLSPLYTLGLAVVAFAMVLLPAIYVALIVLAGWGVVFHLSHNSSLLEHGGIGSAIVFFGPVIAGGILVCFMLKPLFARRAKQPETVSLDPGKELLLFTFVERICRLVHSPMPSRIDVDCQVNASASLRRGFWSRELVLTIGLPLAAGLNMRQFAGVLAHEFGHFAQGAGMRLTYVIRQINFWFARVVFERDQWDVQLERTAKGTDIRLAIILHAARGCIWLTRRILWALMHAGHAISCFMLRQMEFDADSYESKVAGSDAFESTAARLRVLNVAAQFAIEDVRQSWTGNRLPENLPLLVGHKATSLSGDIHQQLNEQATAAKTRWFDTHPCDADRVRAARALNETGVFRLERPAMELFADFAATCKSVTRHQYVHGWGLEFAADNLVSSDEMLRESQANAEADATIRKFYGGVNLSLVPLLTTSAFPPLLDREAALAQWRTTVAQAEQLRTEATQASGDCVKQQQQLAGFTSAFQLTAAGFRVEPKEFDLPAYATSASEQEKAARLAIEESAAALQRHVEKVGGFVAILRSRVTLALQLQSAAGGTSGATEAETATLVTALAAVGGVMPAVHQIGLRLRAFILLVQNRGNHANPQDVDARLVDLSQELKKLMIEIDSPLGKLPYPFPHPRGQLTIADYAHYEKPCENELERVYQDGNAHLERLFALHYRLIGRLLRLVETAEKGFAGQVGQVGK